MKVILGRVEENKGRGGGFLVWYTLHYPTHERTCVARVDAQDELDAFTRMRRWAARENGEEV